MDYITKPSISRLARVAGIKTISEDCYLVIHETIGEEIEKIISTAFIINSGNNTKTLMIEDIRDSFRLNGYNITESNNLGSGKT